MRSLKYEKVYNSWQEGIYPYFKSNDVLTDKSEFMYWWNIDAGYAMGSIYWPEDNTRDLMPLFVLGLEDLEFLAERKEESDLIAYPKVIPVGKIKDLIKPEILDAKECWEWVYIGYEGYEPDVCNQKVMLRRVQIEVFLSNNSGDHIWLKSNEKPLYRLRKKVTFSKLENFYGRTKGFIERKLSYVEYKTDKFVNNIIVTVVQYLIVWLGTVSLYHYYLGTLLTALDRVLELVFPILFLSVFHIVLRSFAAQIKKPFGAVAKLATNLFLCLGVSMLSMPVITESDKEMFMRLSFILIVLIITPIIPLLLEAYSINKVFRLKE